MVACHIASLFSFFLFFFRLRWSHATSPVFFIFFFLPEMVACHIASLFSVFLFFRLRWSHATVFFLSFFFSFFPSFFLSFFLSFFFFSPEMVACHVASLPHEGLPCRVAEGIPDRGRSAEIAHTTLDLVGGGANAPDEIRWESVGAERRCGRR